MSQPADHRPNPYAVQPQQLSPGHERNVGLVAHLVPLAAMILSAGTMGFVGSLVIYLIYKDRGPFAREHAANSLNVQITMAIVLLISIPLMFVLVGFFTYGAAFVVATVLHIIGALKANKGEDWTPPMTPRFIR